MKDILEFANTVDIDDVRAVLKRQIDMNSAIADEGLMHPYGAQIGRTLLQVYGDDVKIVRRREQQPVLMPEWVAVPCRLSSIPEAEIRELHALFR